MKIEVVDRVYTVWMILIGISFVLNGGMHLLNIDILWDDFTDIVAFVGGIAVLGFLIVFPKQAKLLWDERYSALAQKSTALAYMLFLAGFMFLLFNNRVDGVVDIEGIEGVLILSIGVQFLYVVAADMKGN